MTNNILEELTQILEARKTASVDTSYVASLYQKGLNKILEKIGEEATETIIAAKDAEKTGDTKEVIYETADLWFHSMVMLVKMGIKPMEILLELQRRLHIPGLDEKAARKLNSQHK